MNLLKALATTSSMTLLSRILGYVRDTAVAVVFGAGLATDAFMVATKIPNFLRRLFAEGAFSQAFVPILGEYKSQRSADELRDRRARRAVVLGWAGRPRGSRSPAVAGRQGRVGAWAHVCVTRDRPPALLRCGRRRATRPRNRGGLGRPGGAHRRPSL